MSFFLSQILVISKNPYVIESQDEWGWCMSYRLCNHTQFFEIRDTSSNWYEQKLTQVPNLVLQTWLKDPKEQI